MNTLYPPISSLIGHRPLVSHSISRLYLTMPYSSEFLSEIKELVKAKLSELGAFADEELPDYITVMVANRKKRSSMIKDLQLFLGSQTELFTDWLHGILDSRIQQRGSRKDAISERSGLKSSKSQKKEKSGRSSHRLVSSSKPRSARSRSPVQSVKLPSEEPIAADVVNVQTDENEFTEENSHSHPGDNKYAADQKPTEQRRVVSTSSLGSKSTQKSSEELPAVRSVVKVSTNAPSAQSSNNTTASSAAVGGMLLKRAMNEARASTAQAQERPAAVVRGQKRTIEKSEVAAIPQERTKGDVNEAEEAEVPTKMTRFVVTMGEEPLLLKPSVKSRLGPRVVAPITDTSNNVEMLDAREILIAKKSKVKSPRMQIILGDSFGEDEEEEGGEGIVSSANDVFAFEREDDGKSEDKKPDRNAIPSSLQRCKYWPNCRNQGNCQYIHPKEECKAFPSCRFGDRCLYIHPPCRYGAQCSRPGCAFSHAGQDATVSPLTPKVVCRYFPHCKLPVGTCPFYHPPTPVCRFGATCLNRGTTCPFAHPIPAAGAKVGPLTVPVPSNKLKWVAPGKSATCAAAPTAATKKMSSSSSENIIRTTTAATPISTQPVSTEISS
ncbi:zinc finger CCCH domain containing protein 14 [Echinococcus multilocularis]|uniref:Zinc finger CCCH domain-containing protein 14 n=1 Tax=Echinococcus multilocularis TaxID=6211 RepID=A0A068YD64_ECHMU|nr:zinc finger CCCH domain containing protein 14 [Echinococcus multilocularis]